MATVSFANDIAPTLYKYRGQMAWRLDLASYDDVKANAQIASAVTHITTCFVRSRTLKRCLIVDVTAD